MFARSAQPMPPEFLRRSGSSPLVLQGFRLLSGVRIETAKAVEAKRHFFFLRLVFWGRIADFVDITEGVVHQGEC